MRHAHRLLHVMGDDGDGVVVAQFVDQLLDLRGGDRVERRAGSSNRITSGWIATVRAMHRRCCWPPDRLRPLALQLVLDLLPDRGAAQRLFHALVHVGLAQPFVEPDAEGDVLVDGHREGRRLLEHHADLGAQGVEVQLGVEHVLAVEQHLAFGALAGIEVVHAVEDAQQRGLAAARRADEGRDLPA